MKQRRSLILTLLVASAFGCYTSVPGAALPLDTQTFISDAFDRLIKVSERDSVGSGRDWVAVFDGLGRKVRTITTLVVSNTPITSPADAVSTVDSWFDTQVEFQEVGVVVSGGVFNMKTYGPDANGVYGGLQGVGGLERVTPFGHITGIGLIQDFFGNIIGSVSNALYGVTWNPARFSSLGPVPGYQSPALTLNASLAQSVGWRGKHIEPIGTFHWGARPYEPASARFLTHDPVFDPRNPSGFSLCGGDMLNNFDADARFGKQFGGPEFPFSEYELSPQHEALLDELYGPKVTTADIIVGLVNIGASVISLPFSTAEGIGNDVDTAVSGTYVNEYGVSRDASTGRRIFAGTMAALNFLPVGDIAEGGFQAARAFSAAEDFRYGMNGALDAAEDFATVAKTAAQGKTWIPYPTYVPTGNRFLDALGLKNAEFHGQLDVWVDPFLPPRQFLEVSAHESVHVSVAQNFPNLAAAGMLDPSRGLAMQALSGIPLYAEEVGAYGLGYIRSGQYGMVPFAPIAAFGSLERIQQVGAAGFGIAAGGAVWYNWRH